MFISLVDANYDGGLGRANIRYVYGEREGLDNVVEVMKRMEPLEWKDAIERKAAVCRTAKLTRRVVRTRDGKAEGGMEKRWVQVSVKP